MLATAYIQQAILERITALNHFRAVEAYPLARLTEETFPQDLVKLELPAALLVFIDDDHTGRPASRKINWLLLIIASGTHGEAGAFILTAADAIRENVVGQALSDKCFLLPESRVTALDSSDTYTAAAINLATKDHQ